MWLLIVGLCMLLIAATGAYRALYADDFAYTGRHRGGFKSDFDSIKEHSGILTPSQTEL